mmetsp:Transcript_5085/g.17075  ORF Transcript_5085/g.17075 Transcript_5085/m.17075 type:complete len:220 (+) Transcript_5085:3186-3845(+)
MVRAHGGEHHVGRGEVGLHELPEHRGRQLAELARGAHERHAEALPRVGRHVALLRHVLERVGRQVLDLLRVEGLLLVELPLDKGPLEGGLRHHVQHVLDVGLEARHRVGDLLTARRGGRLRAHRLEVAHHLEVRPARRGRERHELQHVGGARVLRGLVARARVDHHAHGGHGRGVRLADHLEAVGQSRHPRDRVWNQALRGRRRGLVVEGHVQGHPWDL